jgi:hypothetical protein
MTTPTNTTTGPRAIGGASIVGTDVHGGGGPGPDVMDAATLIGDSHQRQRRRSGRSISCRRCAGRIAYAVLSFGGSAWQ